MDSHAYLEELKAAGTLPSAATIFASMRDLAVSGQLTSPRAEVAVLGHCQMIALSLALISCEGKMSRHQAIDYMQKKCQKWDRKYNGGSAATQYAGDHLVGAVLHFSKRIKNGRTLSTVCHHLIGELDEIQEELDAVAEGRPPGADGLSGEAIDVIACSADAIFLLAPGMSAERIDELTMASFFHSGWDNRPSCPRL